MGVLVRVGDTVELLALVMVRAVLAAPPTVTVHLVVVIHMAVAVLLLLRLRVVLLRMTRDSIGATPPTKNHCHRCGRSGHIAARCIYDMPQHIKDWVMHNSPRERANTVQRVHFTPSNWNDPNNSDYDSEDEFHGPNDDANIQMPLRI